MTVALQPHSLDEAVRYLEGDPGLVPAAGCTDLMVRGVEALHQMDRVIDLLGIPELRGIREVEADWRSAPPRPFSEIRQSAAVRAAFPSLAEAAAVDRRLADPEPGDAGGQPGERQPGGRLAARPARPGRDRRAGERRAACGRSPTDEFHTGYRKTALQPGEIVARIRLPAAHRGNVQAFRKVGTREAQAISKVVVAMAGRVEDGRIAELRLAAGSVAAEPVRLRAAEQAVAAIAPGPEAAALAGRAAAQEVTPIDDVRSTADYRRFALERVVRRMVLDLTWRELTHAHFPDRG